MKLTLLPTLGALALAASLASGASSAQTRCQYATIAALPLSYSGPGLEMTTVGSINGKPAVMLVDTGAVSVMLTEHGARRHKLALTSTSRTLSAVGGEVPVYKTVVNEVSIGASRAGKTSLQVIGEMGDPSVYDAAIGAPFLLQADLELFLANKELRMFRALDCSSDAFLAYWNPSASVVPFHWGFDGHLNPRFTVQINGKNASAMIDTGANLTSISLSTAKRLGIHPDKARIDRIEDARGWGKAPAARWRGAFKTFQVGQELIENAPIGIIDHDSGMAEVILGTDFLRAYRVLLSMSQKKLYLSYVGGLPFSTGQMVEPWIEAEAQGGNTDAQMRLARAYGAGVGVAKDEGAANAWFERAALAGNGHALLLTGRRLATEGQPKAAAQRLRAGLDKLPGLRDAALWLYTARVRSGEAGLAKSELAASAPADTLTLESLPLTGFYLGKFSADEVIKEYSLPSVDEAARCYASSTLNEWYDAHGIADRPAGLAALARQCTAGADGAKPAAAARP